MSARRSTCCGLLDLLGCHVLGRAHHLADAGEHEILRPVALPTSFARPKSAIFTRPRLSRRMFSGLDVSMDDSLIVGILQGLTDLRHYGQDLLRRQLAGVKRLPKVDALDKLHHEVVELCGLARVVNRHNVRMAQPGHCPGLTGEAFGEGRISAHLRWQNLQGNQPVQSRLTSLVDRPHPADTQQFENLQLRKVPRSVLLDRVG